MSQVTLKLESSADFLAKTQAWVVGDWQSREHSMALARIPSAGDWPRVESLDEACEALSTCEQPPELIFLAQPLPGDVNQQQIDRLQQLSPLTRLILVTGTWCEGELRTGSPPRGVIRLYWYELAPWWQAATRRRDAWQCPLWSLPLDHPQACRWSSEELYEQAAAKKLSVTIDANDYEVFETLATGLSTYGLACTWHRDENTDSIAGAAIWDGGQLSEKELKRLQNLCKKIDGPVVALLDFPRVEHIQQIREAGAQAVFAKPYVLEEVVASLHIRVR